MYPGITHDKRGGYWFVGQEFQEQFGDLFYEKEVRYWILIRYPPIRVFRSTWFGLVTITATKGRVPFTKSGASMEDWFKLSSGTPELVCTEI